MKCLVLLFFFGLRQAPSFFDKPWGNEITKFCSGLVVSLGYNKTGWGHKPPALSLNKTANEPLPCLGPDFDEQRGYFLSPGYTPRSPVSGDTLEVESKMCQSLGMIKRSTNP